MLGVYATPGDPHVARHGKTNCIPAVLLSRSYVVSCKVSVCVRVVNALALAFFAVAS